MLLFYLLVAFFLSGSDANSKDVLPYFYLCFDWLNRRETNVVTRKHKLGELFRLAGNRFEDYSLYYYAKSAYVKLTEGSAEALDEAERACVLAPDNPGWLNNYAELLLEVIEDATLAGMETLEECDADRIDGFNLERFLSQ